MYRLVLIVALVGAVKIAPVEGFGIGAICAARRRFEVATPDMAALPVGEDAN